MTNAATTKGPLEMDYTNVRAMHEEWLPKQQLLCVFLFLFLPKRRRLELQLMLPKTKTNFLVSVLNFIEIHQVFLETSCKR